MKMSGEERKTIKKITKNFKKRVTVE